MSSSSCTSSMTNRCSANKRVCELMEPGDAIEFPRGIYSHWALCCEKGKLIHLAGVGDGVSNNMANPGKSFSIGGMSFKKAKVVIQDFWEVVGSSVAKIRQTFTSLTPDEIVARAMELWGPIEYNFLWNNCEHFVNYCRHGEASSSQTQTAVGLAVFGALAAAAGAWLFSEEDKRKEPQ